MSELRRDPNIPDPDGFYQALIDAVQRLSPEDALRFSARLNLLLANQVGDRAVLDETIRIARKGLEETS